MQKLDRSLFLFLLVLLGLTFEYWLGLPAVPFHPDESTQMFTSGDLEIFWNKPADVFWREDKQEDIRQLYRELDAPLTRLLIGIGRTFAGLPPLPVDWDWSKSWVENQNAGALPSQDLLLIARFAVAFFFPLSLVFMFLTAKSVSGNFTAWLAMLLLASNALVLLHTRRSMAESALLFTTMLLLWSLTQAQKRPWLVAVSAALAFCAKQSLLALTPVGILAVLWQPALPSARRSTQVISRIVIFTVIFVSTVVLLHPFLWNNPVKAVQSAIEHRQELAAAQAEDRPEQSLTTLDRKLISMIGSLYFTPPSFSETANYTAETRQAEEIYLANPLHSLFRSLPAGAFLWVIGLFGMVMAGLRAAKSSGSEQRLLILLLASTLFQAIALLVMVPLPWQRYYMPLVPFACLWTGYGLDHIRQAVFVSRKTAVSKTGTPG